jgi:hypothetical protein
LILGYRDYRFGKIKIKETGNDVIVKYLVESGDFDILIGIFLDDAKSILVRVEGGHKNKRNADIRFRIQVLRRAVNQRVTQASR